MPVFIGLTMENWLLIYTWNVLVARKYLSTLISWLEILMEMSLNNKPSYHTLSNAFPTSRRAVTVLCLWLNLIVILSTTLRSWVIVLWLCLKPNCSGCVVVVIYVRSRIWIIFWKTLEIVLRKEI